MKRRLLTEVRSFATFTPENDPHGEHETNRRSAPSDEVGNIARILSRQSRCVFSLHKFNNVAKFSFQNAATRCGFSPATGHRRLAKLVVHQWFNAVADR
jgi:hypothetical protein